MGLFRLYWVPRGRGPREGAFVRYPARDLLTITALESERARAFVVGEDLGTVEEGVREELADRRILSYKLLWFEDRPPAEYPALSLAAVTTHDLPTIPGLWSGEESRRLRERGLVRNEEGLARMRVRLAERAGLSPGAPVEEAVRAAHRALGRAPSVVVTATLEDALGVAERPNMPGTTSEWPNWRIPLPLTVERIEADPRPRMLARELAAARAQGSGPAIA
jgi:4-alpha-glucanotransferase